MISNQLTFFINRLNSARDGTDKLVSLIVLVIILSVTPIGYHIIALNVPSPVIQKAITEEFGHRYGLRLTGTSMDLIWSFVVSCQSIGALFGCILVVPMERRFVSLYFGTKRSLLLINNLLLVLASICFMAISQHTNILFLLTFGRLLVGFYTGIGCALVPIYVTELSPHQLKGALCCFVHIAICAGSALGAFLSLENLLGGPSTWTALLSLPILLALSQIFLGHFLMETPSYFLRRNDQMAAVNSIRFHYSLDAHLDPATVLVHYHSLVSKMPPQISLRQSFGEPKVRTQILLGMAISMAQIFSGSMAAVSYSTTMLESVALTAWLTPFIPTLGSLLSILMTLPALRFVESCGRKQLLVNTLGICAIANFLLVIFSLLAQLFAGQTKREQSWASIGFLLCFFLYGIGYNVGVGPVAYFLPAELVPPNAVSAAMGAATAVNWLSSMLTTIVYYPLNELIGGWSFLVFALPTTFFAIFFHRELPDNIDGDNGFAFAEQKHSHNPSTSSGPTRTAPNNPITEGSIANDNEEYGDFGSADENFDTGGQGQSSKPRNNHTFSLPVEQTPLQHQTSASTSTSGASTAWYSTFGSP